MNLLYFIRLLLKHRFLLIISPIIVTVVIFYFTKDEPEIYESSAQIYTGITSGSSIVSVDDSKVDRLTSLISFDNMISTITSRSTLEEVSIRLLATHLLLNKPVSEIISKEHFNQLMQNIPEKVKKLVVADEIENTIDNLTKYKESNYTNYIYELVNSNHPHYGTKEILSRIKVKRVRSSDLIEISFTSNDPGICKKTLELLIEVFEGEYTENRLSQTHDVVKYFEQQLANVYERLENAEDELLYFNKKNEIINYYEQTEQITTEKKDFNLKHLDVKMAYAGAKSAIVALEGKMSEKQKQRLNNQSIQGIREKLAKINFEITMNTLSDLVDEQTINLDSLLEQASKLENELRTRVQNQYDLEYGREGVGTKFILDQWIENVIELESTRAKLNVAELQEKKFNELYLKYAPLGATMKKLERKIDVIEREYLQILNDLGVAKLKQQSIELNSNLKVSDPPLFPLESKPSKRVILILIGLIVGFIIPAFLIIVLDFLDQNLKTADRAEKKTGLVVAAIFPKLVGLNKKIDINFIKSRGLDVIARRLILNTENSSIKNRAEINILFSSIDKEGKTTIATLLIEKLASFGYSILFITNNDKVVINGAETQYYTIDESFHRAETIKDLVPGYQENDYDKYDYIFIEIPGVLQNTYPISLFKNSDHSFLVTRANRAWSKADAYALNDILGFAAGKAPQVILNGVELGEMETVLGDLPRKRSGIRRIIKNILQLQFFSKNKLTKK